MKPICVPCQRFFRPKKNDFFFTEMMPKAGTNYPPAGTAAPELWEPYKVWAGDLYECEGCGAQIVSGFGRAPLSEHYLPEFSAVRQRYGAEQLEVKDC